jgi:integrase
MFGPMAHAVALPVATRAKPLPVGTWHALRHTHASQLIDANVDIVTISKRLGHKNPNITLQIYAHLFKQRDDKAATAINAALAELSRGQ